ncbi:hypothetical protein CLOSCI_02378 [[Clostridium] scindens ATCC 35704]|nr:hypothetical protein CLOSCI_02378 [[Clostridium] scindens ATCC 35704]
MSILKKLKLIMLLKIMNSVKKRLYMTLRLMNTHVRVDINLHFLKTHQKMA